jgi:hypothetical protein
MSAGDGRPANVGAFEMTKTFKIKSSAVRAAKQAGLDVSTLVILQNPEGLWFYEPVGDRFADAPVVEAEAVEDDVDLRPRFLREPSVTSPIGEQIAAALSTDDGVVFEAPQEDALSRLIARGKAKVQIAETADKTPTPKVKAPKAPRQPKAKVEGGRVRRADGLVEGSAAAKLVDAVLSPGGATFEELKALVGWSECRPYLKKVCAQANVRLTLVKGEGRAPGRYQGERAA